MNNFLNRYSKIIVSLILLAMFSLGFFSMLGDSGTTDEIAHIPAGYGYVKFHDARLNPEHPLLIKAIAAIPLLFLDLKFDQNFSAWKNEINGQWETGWKFIYQWENSPEKIFLWSRLPILILALILGIYIYKGASEVFGKKVGILALFFYALSPTILAHSRYVTTDLGFSATFFITIYYFYKFLKSQKSLDLILAAVFFGIAQLSKFSNLILTPYLILAMLFFVIFSSAKINFSFLKNLKKEWHKKFGLFIFSLFIILFFGFLVVFAGYWFFSYNMPTLFFHQAVDSIVPRDSKSIISNSLLHLLADYRVIQPFQWYLLGIKMVGLHLQSGHATYFWGLVGKEGWWYFYPLSFLIKTPVSMIIIFFFSIFSFLRVQSSKFKVQSYSLPNGKQLSKLTKVYFWFKDWFNKNLFEFICWSALATIWYMGVSSKLNIGLRHVLPVYVFTSILCAKYFVQIFGADPKLRIHPNDPKRMLLRHKFKLGIGAGLLIWYLLSNFLTYPHYLAYFNEFINRDKAYKYTIDSNLDWGQDAKRLAQWVEKNNIKKITVDYFGGSVPEYYLGDKMTPWHISYGRPPVGYFAISATFYQNSRYFKKIGWRDDDYSWLDSKEPIANIGGSILVYKIE